MMEDPSRLSSLFSSSNPSKITALEAITWGKRERNRRKTDTRVGEAIIRGLENKDMLRGIGIG